MGGTMRQQENLLLTILTESTWTYASWVNIRLIKSGNNYVLKGRHYTREILKPFLRPKLQKVKVDALWAESLVKKLCNAQIPAFPPPRIGCDGGFTTLIIGDYWGRSSFRWWVEAPIEWKILEEIADEIKQKFYDGIGTDED